MNDLFLKHHGILGQQWGKRNGPPYPLGASEHSASEKKAGWRKSLDQGQDIKAKRALAHQDDVMRHGKKTKIDYKKALKIAGITLGTAAVIGVVGIAAAGGADASDIASMAKNIQNGKAAAQTVLKTASSSVDTVDSISASKEVLSGKEFVASKRMQDIAQKALYEDIKQPYLIDSHNLLTSNKVYDFVDYKEAFPEADYDSFTKKTISDVLKTHGQDYYDKLKDHDYSNPRYGEDSVNEYLASRMLLKDKIDKEGPSCIPSSAYIDKDTVIPNVYKKFQDQSGVKAFINPAVGEVYASTNGTDITHLPAKNIRALRNYTRESTTINSLLRGCFDKEKSMLSAESIRKTAGKVHDAIDKTSMKEDMMLYR